MTWQRARRTTTEVRKQHEQCNGSCRWSKWFLTFPAAGTPLLLKILAWGPLVCVEPLVGLGIGPLVGLGTPWLCHGSKWWVVVVCASEGWKKTHCHLLLDETLCFQLWTPLRTTAINDNDTMVKQKRMQNFCALTTIARFVKAREFKKRAN